MRAMDNLRKHLELFDHDELAEKIHSSKNSLDGIYSEYTHTLSSIETIVEKYYKTFRTSHEEYVHASRVRHKSGVGEKSES